MPVKLLVFSDSHSSCGLMKRFVEKIKPNAIAHLGDYYDDGQVIGESYFHIPLYQVAGNCDAYRAPMDARGMLFLPLGDVMTFMVHGHTHHVKSGIGRLVADGREKGAKLILYGHTHIAYCQQEEDGIWVMNPGPAGYGGSCGLVEIENGEIKSCRILTEADL